jgi:membrane-bound lytic murein transglycosylase B
MERTVGRIWPSAHDGRGNSCVGSRFSWLHPTALAAATKRGVSRSNFAKYTAALTPDLRIMDLLDNQPEFTKSVWDYLDILVTNERIERAARWWKNTAPCLMQ